MQNEAGVLPALQMIADVDQGYVSRSHIRDAFRGTHAQLLQWQIHEDRVMAASGVCAEIPLGDILR